MTWMSKPALSKLLHHPLPHTTTSGNQNQASHHHHHHWPALIRQCYSNGSFLEALHIYIHHLPSRTRHPLLPLLLKSCAALSLPSTGASLHAESLKSGQLSNTTVATSLLSMYSKFGSIRDARQVFDEMPERNVVTYNAMVSAYSDLGDVNSARTIFEKMRERTYVSWLLMIRALARTGDVAGARWFFEKTPIEMRNVAVWTAMVHGYTTNGEMGAAARLFEDMPWRNSFVWSSMIAGHFKKGSVKEARGLFDLISVKNAVNWNVLIAGYAQNGCPEEALDALRNMMKDGLEPDEVTVVSALSASSQLGMLKHGRWIHDLIEQKRIKMNEFVLNGLVDMYAKCGDIGRARRIFEEMEMDQRNVVCWNTIISALSSHGLCAEALEVFSQMEVSRVRADEITYLAVLSACTHGGFVDEGMEILDKMGRDGLVAGVAHYGCLVDLLGRAGRLEEAYNIIRAMPVEPNHVVWGGFLGACRVHSDAKMAGKAIDELCANRPIDSFSEDMRCVLLSSIFPAPERWEKAKKFRMKMAADSIHKTPGCSSIMVGI